MGCAFSAGAKTDTNKVASAEKNSSSTAAASELAASTIGDIPVKFSEPAQPVKQERASAAAEPMGNNTSAPKDENEQLAHDKRALAYSTRDSVGSQQSATIHSTLCTDGDQPRSHMNSMSSAPTFSTTASSGNLDTTIVYDGDERDSRSLHPSLSIDGKGSSRHGATRVSTDSTKSGSSSGRSSFAQECGAADAKGKAASAPAGSTAKLPPVPPHLDTPYRILGALSTEVPVPLLTLQLLWGCSTMGDAHAVAEQLQRIGALRLASLDDGSTWCMPNATHVSRLVAGSSQPLSALHEQLVQKYTRGGVVAPCDIQDDGYVLLNIVQHLLCAGDAAAARQLLLNPYWLEQKLLAYGSTSLVSDFRRYLQEQEDADVKLVLHALQMAMATCLERPTPGIVCHQMISRLQSAASTMQAWYDEHRLLASIAVHEALQPGYVGDAPHLLPRTASLGQAGGLQCMILQGHKGAISKLLISPNGREIVTASADGTAQVWDMDIGDCMLQLVADQQPITALAVSRDGNHCVTASKRGTMFIWDLRSGEMVHALQGHAAQVNSVAYDPKERYIISASADCTARVWHPVTGKCQHILAGHGADVAASSLGAVWAAATSDDGDMVATTSDDFTARIWNPIDGMCETTLKGHTGWVVGVVFYPGSALLATASHDMTVRVWNGITGRCRGTLKGHTGRVNKVAVCAAGNCLVSASDDFTARVWDAQSCAAVCVLAGHSGWVSDVAVSQDGAFVLTASGDTNAALWDAKTGDCLETMEGHCAEVTAVALTPKGRFAMTASTDGTARVWDMHASSQQTPDAHKGRVISLQVLPDQHTVASIGDDCVLRLWRVATGECVRAVKGHPTSLKWLHAGADSRTLVTAGADHRVCRWTLSGDTTQCACAVAVGEHRGSRVKSVAVDAACRTAAVVLFDSTCSIWDLTQTVAAGGEEQEPRMLIRRAERDISRTHSGGVNAVYMSADGARVLTVSKDFTARLWDTAACETVAVLAGHTDGVVAGVFSPDDRLVATASFDCTARVWDVAEGACVATLQHAIAVTDVVFSPNGRLLLAITEQHQCVLWDLETGSALASLLGHKDTVHGAAFSLDSAYVATYAEDSAVLVWSCVDGHLAAVFLADAAITCARFAAAPPAGAPARAFDDGGLGVQLSGCLVASDASGAVHFLDFPAA